MPTAQWCALWTLAAVAWSVDSLHLTEGGVGTRYTAVQCRVCRVQRLGRWSDADAVRALHAVRLRGVPSPRGDLVQLVTRYHGSPVRSVTAPTDFPRSPHDPRSRAGLYFQG